jgi:hypothetical protein
VDLPTATLVEPEQGSKRRKPIPPPPSSRVKSRPQAGDMRYGKSAQANGTVLIPGVDGRSGWVRRAKELIDEHISDLGGIDNVSAAEKSIVRRASTISVELERLEKKFALAGEANADDLDLYARVAANQRRLLESIGLRRRSRDVTLAQYLNGREEIADRDIVQRLDNLNAK